ncbi:MAG: hypothetical protein QOG50_3817, partial [Actinomycetota bacterium]|nr:hypothetical protein [Actinomycetota bacterium]
FWKGTPRYAAPGLALGLVILPVALSRASRRALLLTPPAYAATLAATQFDSRLWRAWWPPSHHLAVVAAVALALLAGIASAVGVSRPTRLELRPALPIGIAVLVVLSLASGFALKGYRQTFADHGTQGERAASFLRARHVRHARIALTGSLLVSGSQYAFYDKRLTNFVQFIAQRVADHRVAPFTQCASFVHAVDAGHYDYVVVPVASARVGGPATWLESNRTARRLDRGGLAGAAVFEITGTLDPARCGKNR